MKNLFWVFTFLLIFSGCTDFYHVHYPKLKKVPATGEVVAFVAREKKLPQEKTNIPLNSICEKENSVSIKSDSNRIGIQNIFSANEKKTDSDSIPLKTKNDFQKTTSHSFKKTTLVKKNPILRIIGLLLLGLILLAYGIGIIVAGIFAASLLIACAGILVALLGILPFLGLISMLVGDRFTRDDFEEKKKSSFSNHQ